MDLLDHYAAAALTGLCAEGARTFDELVPLAYRIARAMLRARDDAFMASQQDIANKLRRDM